MPKIQIETDLFNACMNDACIMEEDWEYWREQLAVENKYGLFIKRVRFEKGIGDTSMVFPDVLALVPTEKSETRHWPSGDVIEPLMLAQRTRHWTISKALKRVATSLRFKRSISFGKVHFSQRDTQHRQLLTLEHPIVISDLKHFDSPQKRPVVIKFSPVVFMPEECWCDHLHLSQSHLMETRYHDNICPRIQVKFLRATRKTPRFTGGLMDFEVNPSLFSSKHRKSQAVVLDRPWFRFDRCNIFDDYDIVLSWTTTNLLHETKTAVSTNELEPLLIDDDLPRVQEEAKDTTKLSDDIQQAPSLKTPHTIVVSVAALQIPMLLDSLLTVTNLIVVERDIPAKIINTSPGHSTLILDLTDKDYVVPFDSIAIIGSDRDRLLQKALRQWPPCKILFFDSCLDFVSWITLQLDDGIEILEEATAVNSLIDILPFVA